MFLFTAVWMKSLRKMTLSPVWTKGACSTRGENSLSREQNQKAERSRNSLETPTSHTEPRGNTNTPKSTAPAPHSQFKQKAMLEPFTQSNQSAPGTRGTAGAKVACKAHTGSCVWLSTTAQVPPNHTDLPQGRSHPLHQAESHEAAE